MPQTEFCLLDISQRSLGSEIVRDRSDRCCRIEHGGGGGKFLNMGRAALWDRMRHNASESTPAQGPSDFGMLQGGNGSSISHLRS